MLDSTETKASGVASAREACDGPASRMIVVAVILLALIGTVGGVFGGPALGDHEAIVAQAARDMRLTGDWLVPRFLDTPFFRKPPLPYWLIAGASCLFPDDLKTHLPVTTTVARLPSALAAFGTVLLLWRLASSMFGRRTGVLAAVVASSSLFFLLYSPNATAEMVLTFCCTWAYLHFWYAVTARRTMPRLVHLFLFYVAMGLAMLAKGPAPIAVTAMPLAFWWYAERPLRLLARLGAAGWRKALLSFLRHFGARTVQVFTRLWLIPGLAVFALFFVPWMIAVGQQYPHAWNLWNWQYWQRAQGNYEDTRVRNIFYYLPVVAGLVLPWLFLIVEAAIAPWIRRYARYRRALLYAGLWAAVAILVMSLMQFKKPYYIAPAIPGLILLMAVVARRFYEQPPLSARIAGIVWGALAIGSVVLLVVGSVWLRRATPEVWVLLTAISALVILALLAAGLLYVRNRPWHAFALTALTTAGAFHAVWYSCGQAIDNVDKAAALAKALDDLRLPADADILWADQRPDARLSFYFNRRTKHMVTPAEIVSVILDRTRSKEQIKRLGVDRAAELLRASKPVYLILDRKNLERWKDDIAARGHVLATVPLDPTSPGSDWLVVSNAAEVR